MPAPGPNQVRRGDITDIPTDAGWPYLAAVLDLTTRKVAGWARCQHLRAELACAALLMAAQRPAKGLVAHAERGSQDAAGP